MRCCVQGCLNDSRFPDVNKKITYHSFPTAEPYRSAWLHAVGKNIWTVKVREKVCSEHFHTKDLYVIKKTGGTRIRTAAIPSCNLKKSPEVISIQSQLLKICRLCLKIKMDLHSLNAQADVYQNLTGLTINTDDALPYRVCTICKYRLRKHEAFKQSCLRANNILMEALKNKDTSILEKIKSTELDNDLQITTRIDTYDLIVTEIDDGAEIDDVYFENFNGIHEDVTEGDEVTADDEAVPECNDETMPEWDDEAKPDVENVLKYDGEVKSDDEAVPQYDNKVKPDYEAVLEYDDKSIIDDTTDGNDIDLDTDQIDIKQDLSEEPEKKTVLKNIKNVPETEKIAYKEDVKKEPTFNADSFEEIFNISDLSLEEQIQLIEARKNTSNYKNGVFKCSVCFKGYLDENAYKSHLMKHSDVWGLYECHVCKIRFSKKMLLRKHLSANHKYKFTCNLCEFVCTNSGVAKRHHKWHKGTKYSCPHCDQVYEIFSTYMSHLRIRHPSDFVCGLCGYSFVSVKGIQVHKNFKHKGSSLEIPPDGPFCEPCNVRFATNDAYKKHLSISPKHNESLNKLPVKIRRKGVNKKNEKKTRNVRSYENGNKRKKRLEGPIPCEQCGEQLEHMRAYHAHFRRIHPDKNRTNYPTMRTPSMCETCGKMFQGESLLRDHRWIHTGGSQFVCDLCGKSYMMKTRLIDHKRRRHSENPRRYPCDVCGKFLHNSANRRRHMLIHTGLKPYKCEICDKAFTDRFQKRAHINYVHLKQPWPKRNRPNRRKQSTPSPTVSTDSQED